MNIQSNIYVLYSDNKEDIEYKNELIKHLASLEESKRINILNKDESLPGANRNWELKTQIEETDIVLVFISADMLNQIKKLERFKKKSNIKILLIASRPCVWKDFAILNNCKWLNKGNSIGVQKENKSTIYKGIIEELRTVIIELEKLFIEKKSGINELRNIIGNKGLVAYYTFNGNADDESGNNNHGDTVGVKLTKDRFGIKEHAYFFDGKDDFIHVPSSKSLESIANEITISVWLNIKDSYRNFAGAPTGWIKILSKANRENVAPYIKGGFPEQYGFYMKKNEGISLTGKMIANYKPFQIPIDKWFCLAVTYKNGVVSFYKDGLPLGKVRQQLYFIKNTMPLEIGVHRPGATEFYHGSMDDLRIYKRCLAQKEIKEIYKLDETIIS